MKDGKLLLDFQDHDKLPLDDSGTNDYSNLMLIKNDPYHKVITNTQIEFSKKLKAKKVLRIYSQYQMGIYIRNRKGDTNASNINTTIR